MKQLLTKGHGIIITGGQGAGKLSLAKIIAESIGFFAMADFKGLTGLYNSVFLTGPEVLIVTQFNPTVENLAAARELVSDDKIVVERRGYDPEVVDLPCFIFVTNAAQSVKLAEAGRRFTVIRMEGPV